MRNKYLEHIQHEAFEERIPKRKGRRVTSQRWFAVFESAYQKDGVKWKGPRTTKALSQQEFPNALAYVKAECEVELSDDISGGGG